MARMLSDLQRRRYQQDGILFPICVFSASEADTYRRACEELEAELGGKPRTIEVRQMHLHFPWAYELATQPRILDAVEDLLGPDLLIWATELFAKHSQDSAVSIGWHRDRPYMGFEPSLTTTAWVALSDSTVANGCMRAVPGPRRREHPPLTTSQAPAIDDREIADIVLAAGEMSLHDAEIVHGSGPNLSSGRRVGFVIRFVTPQARPLSGQPLAVLVRGRDDYHHFRLVDPPAALEVSSAVAGMKKSAAEHFDAMLHNLKGAQP